MSVIVIGVLALQGAFIEHVNHLQKAALSIQNHTFKIIEVRNENQLDKCDALVIPGGESTSMSLVAQRTGLLKPLREFVKFHRKPTWGTCAGLILLAEKADRQNKDGQELIGGLDIVVERNHFGRQSESFATQLKLDFLNNSKETFPCVFIRAPIVRGILNSNDQETSIKSIIAPSIKPKQINYNVGEVEVLAEYNDNIVGVRQGNCFGISFHPELTDDIRIHEWWLKNCVLKD